MGKVSLVFGVVLISVSVFLLGFVAGEIYTENVCTGSDEKPHFIEIAIGSAEEINKKAQKNDSINCQDYASNLLSKYKRAGYNAEPKSVWKPSSDYCMTNESGDTLSYDSLVQNVKKDECVEAHRIVKVGVFVEPITGEVIPPSKVQGG